MSGGEIKRRFDRMETLEQLFDLLNELSERTIAENFAFDGKRSSVDNMMSLVDDIYQLTYALTSTVGDAQLLIDYLIQYSNLASYIRDGKNQKEYIIFIILMCLTQLGQRSGFLLRCLPNDLSSIPICKKFLDWRRVEEAKESNLGP